MMHVDQATAKVDLESLVDKYEKISNSNFDNEDKIKSLNNSINADTKNKSSKAVDRSSKQNEIASLHIKINENEKELREIEEKIKKEVHIPKPLFDKLEKARQILHESLDKIPWSGLGIDHFEKAITISINAASPESYREIIEELVGKDIPVIIKQGMPNPFLTCANRTTDCSDLIGGLAIGDDNDTWDCTLGFAVMRDGDKGYLTAGHCFEKGELVYQPDSQAGVIGIVLESIFNESCDCAFINMTSNDNWSENVYYKLNREKPIEAKGTPVPGYMITISGALTDVLDYGLVVDTNFSCVEYDIWGNPKATVEGLYTTKFTSIGPGDSGAPVFRSNSIDKTLYGIVSCMEQLDDDDVVFVPWSTIQAQLGVS